MSIYSLINGGKRMPRTKKQFEEMRKLTRKKIQTAALHLFARKGLSATNVQEIADIAGISIGLLYKHYRTKEDMFYELVEIAFNGLKEISIRLCADESPKVILERIIDEIYEELANNEDFTNLLKLLTQALLSSREDEKLARLLAEDFTMLQALANLIRRGQELGEFRSGDSFEMAIFFLSTIQGITIMQEAFQPVFKLPAKSFITNFLYEE
jgi:AcrR family transcriptional regulator